MFIFGEADPIIGQVRLLKPDIRKCNEKLGENPDTAGQEKISERCDEGTGRDTFHQCVNGAIVLIESRLTVYL